jgi:two-component system sensor histidine kinase BaeS
MGALRPPVPRVETSLRLRLIIGFLAVVSIALVLVFISLPRLLDGYFQQQSQDDLRLRAGEVRAFVVDKLAEYAFSDPPQPILMPTDPPVIADNVRQELAPDSKFVTQLLPIARANITISIATDADHPDQVAYQVTAPFPDSLAEPGQEREPITADAAIAVPDQYWSQSAGGAPQRLLTVTLSDPFTFRAQTLQTIVGVMLVAALIALIAAVIISILIADRLSHPIRRLTNAARELSEGHLDVRVGQEGSTPEVSELTQAFNAMAERLESSVAIIRRDRDRSRDFLADVSHELRTPIAALRTFNELLGDGGVADEETRREFIEQSRQQIERLDWLSTNLLELSKLDSGLVLLDLRPDDLRAVVESAVAQAQPSAQRKRITLAANVPDDPLRQRHDPQRLGQVLNNLIGNAIKFTPPGGRVDVYLLATPAGAELRVRDTGVGIAPGELPHIFDRFYRGASANELRATGSGLGLSIVRSIVEMHSGRIAVQSAPGRGTEVTVSLPRDISVSSPAAGPA